MFYALANLIFAAAPRHDAAPKTFDSSSLAPRLRQPLDHYMIGSTVLDVEGKHGIYEHDLKRWLAWEASNAKKHVMMTYVKGLDFVPIDLFPDFIVAGFWLLHADTIFEKDGQLHIPIADLQHTIARAIESEEWPVSLALAKERIRTIPDRRFSPLRSAQVIEIDDPQQRDIKSLH